MSSLMDSAPVLEKRMAQCGVTLLIIQAFVDKGLDTLAKLAFACPQGSNGHDETAFKALLTEVLGSLPDSGAMASLRRVIVESQTLMMADLKQKVERKESDEPRKVRSRLVC